MHDKHVPDDSCNCKTKFVNLVDQRLVTASIGKNTKLYISTKFLFLKVDDYTRLCCGYNLNLNIKYKKLAP